MPINLTKTKTNMSNPGKKLENRVILVTGASYGIGRAAALRFAAEGATVILLARSEDALNEVYDAIEAAGGKQPAVIPFDLEKAPEEAYFELRNALAKEFGHLDGLLLNAGVLGAKTPMANYNWQTWQKVMQVNVNSQFLMARTLLPLLEAAPGHASLLFTSSSVGRRSKAYWGAYAVSKFAIEGLMQTMATELENISNVRVNSINPGGTRTGMRAEAYPAEDPINVPAAEEILDKYVLLMSDEGKIFNGQALDAQ